MHIQLKNRVQNHTLFKTKMAKKHILWGCTYLGSNPLVTKWCTEMIKWLKYTTVFVTFKSFFHEWDAIIYHSSSDIEMKYDFKKDKQLKNKYSNSNTIKTQEIKSILDSSVLEELGETKKCISCCKWLNSLSQVMLINSSHMFLIS